MAVVEAISLIWPHFLEDIPFTVRSDHAALERKLHKSTHDPPVSARQARWIERLLPFALQFQHIPGKDNVVADTLSRHPHLYLNTTTVLSAQLAGLLHRMATAAEDDQEYKDKRCRIRDQDDTTYTIQEGLILTPQHTILVPADDTLRTLLMSEAHDSRLSGHFGEARTLEKLRRNWEWGGMTADVREYV